MTTAVDPANVRPGELPPFPHTKDELLIEALRHADRVSGLLNEIYATLSSIEEAEMAGAAADEEPKEKPKYDALHELLLRRHSDCSGLHLFIAADNLRLDLPADLRGDPELDDDEE